jgi:hypothetical protein
MNEMNDWRDGTLYIPVEGMCVVCRTSHEIGLHQQLGYMVCKQHASMKDEEIKNIIENRRT